MVTMATSTPTTTSNVTPADNITSHKSRLDPATLKFTAVKVDVSQLTKRCKCKAFVISSQTTSRDLADMVLRKLKIDIKGHVTGTCLLTEKPGGGKVLLDPDEKVLSSVASKSRKAITFELVPAESIDPILLLTSLTPQTGPENDVIKAGNLSGSTRNGLTLPGYKQVDANCNVAVGDGFLTSTPNPDTDSVASTTDSGFMIHYEPYANNGVDKSEARRVRSKSFELATENGYHKLDLSGGNASDSGMIVNGNGHRGNDGWTSENGLEGYPYRPSPRDGFQIMQSKNSAWTPFSRHASDSGLKGFSHHVMQLTGSVPDVSCADSSTKKVASVQRRRSLPKMSLSREELTEKKRSITDLFALKLKLYMDRSPKRTPSFDTTSKSDTSSASLRDIPPQSLRDDDVMSVTSQEVAEILSSASPLRPYEELQDDVTPSEGTASPAKDNQREPTSQNVFKPLPNIVQQPFEKSSPRTKHIGALAEQSPGAYVKQSPLSTLDRHHRSSSHSRKDKGTPQTGSSPGEPRRPSHTPQITPVRHLDRGVPLFTLLTTHMLAPVMLRRNLQITSQFLGVRLCDVTYAKCVRHVIRHWETSSRHFSIDAKLAECMVVAVGGIDRRSTVVMIGKLFRGDIIIEVNGKTTLQMSAREVMEMMSRPDVVSLVVARSRLNVERAQSP